MHCPAQSGQGVLDSPADINPHRSNFLLHGAGYAPSSQMALGTESSYLGNGSQQTFSVGASDSRGRCTGTRLLQSAGTAAKVLTSGGGCVGMASRSRGLAYSSLCGAEPVGRHQRKGQSLRQHKPPIYKSRFTPLSLHPPLYPTAT